MKIILYVLDSLRFDHVSCYGYERQTTPNIDRLAADGVVFERCYAPSTWTRPVAASLLTGTYPGVHGVRGRRDVFSAAIPRLPALFHAAGYRTACVSAIGNVSTAMGFAEGFDYFCDLYREPDLLQHRMRSTGAVEGLEDSEDIVFPYAEDINQYFFPWLKENRAQDVFALLWSIQPHAPYEPPEGFRKFVSAQYDGRFTGKRDMVRRARDEQDTRDLIDLYDSEIAYNDHMIGKILHELEENGLYDETLFIVLGDHGESFGEHGLFSHGHLPYDVVMQVPLVVKFPKNAHSGARVSQLASLVDIMPTLLSASGVEYPQDADPILMGKDLAALLEDPAWENHDCVYCETLYSETKPVYYGAAAEEWKYLKMTPPQMGKGNLKNLWDRLFRERIIFSILRNPMWLLRRYGKMKGEMLFDTVNDPGETENVFSQHPEAASRMQALLSDWLEQCRAIVAEYVTGFAEGEDDAKLREHLQALGYMD